MMRQTFPEYHSHLRGLLGKLAKELPGPMTGFGQLHKAGLADGALSVKVKELIALAIAVSARCEGCMPFTSMTRSGLAPAVPRSWRRSALRS
jgi:alkylhydroperoxidase/carboxymuconolactone decarboxylase family protein YurZ